MRERIRNSISTGSKPIAVVATFVSIWLVCVVVPQNLYLLFRSGWQGQQASQTTLSLLSIQYYIVALSLGFRVFIAIRVIQLARQNFSALRGVILPPYTGRTTNSQRSNGFDFSPIDTKRRLQISIVAFVVSYGFIFLAFTTVFTDLTRVGQYLESVSQSSTLLVGIIESLLLFPPDHLVGTGLREMNPEAVAGNLLLLWFPAAINILGFANLSGVFYSTYRRSVCAMLVAINDLFF